MHRSAVPPMLDARIIASVFVDIDADFGSVDFSAAELEIGETAPCSDRLDDGSTGLLTDPVVVTWKSGTGGVVLTTELLNEAEDPSIESGDIGEGLASLELELLLLI